MVASVTGKATALWRLLAPLGAAGALTLAGCGTGTPPPSGTPTTSRSTTATTSSAASRPTDPNSPSATPVPTPPPTDPSTAFGADGIGPYLIGAQPFDLQACLRVSDVV